MAEWKHEATAARLAKAATGSTAPAATHTGHRGSNLDGIATPHSGRGRVDEVAKCAEVQWARPRGDRT